MSKGYTIAFFINEINTKVKRKNNSFTGIINLISPTYGVESVKFKTLNSFVGGGYVDIVNGYGKYAGFGKTPKTRLLKALKLRKKFGFSV